MDVKNVELHGNGLGGAKRADLGCVAQMCCQNANIVEVRVDPSFAYGAS